MMRPPRRLLALPLTLAVTLLAAPACFGQSSADASAAPPAAAVAGAAPASGNAPPRLLVIVSLDQCRTEYLSRFLPLLPEGGFRRLLEQGAVFPDAAHTHTVTSTGPGHAALATGCLPARAGVPENEFIEDGKRSYCASDPAARLVGSVPGLPDSRVSARCMERPTLGDLLQEELGEEAVVCSFSWKDRTALLMGGPTADGAYWIDSRTGTWVTTDALRPALPDWLAALNARDDLAAHAGLTWLRTVDVERAQRYAGPDDAPGESDPRGLGVVFPHVLPGIQPATPPAPPSDPGAPTATDTAAAAPVADPAAVSLRKLCSALAMTPVADDAVLAAVRGALEHEALGRDDVPDLLCVGFSALDYAGHACGPRSQEVLEVFLAVDRRLAELLALLDERVGTGRWTLALTSDHGVAELPEQSGALRVTQEELQAALEAALTARHGPPPPRADETAASGNVGTASDHGHAGASDGAGAAAAAGTAKPAHWIRAILRPSVWLDPDTVAAAGLALSDVAAEVAGILGAQPGIEAAATRAQLLLATDPDLRALAADVHPTRSGEVLFLCARGTVFTRDVATDHGTHHDYDRCVPVIFLGAGIRAGSNPGPAAPIDIMPTLARLAGLADPEGVDGHVLSAALR